MLMQLTHIDGHEQHENLGNIHLTIHSASADNFMKGRPHLFGEIESHSSWLHRFIVRLGGAELLEDSDSSEDGVTIIVFF